MNNKPKLLIADDDELMTDLVVDLFDDFDCTVAYTGSEALSAFDKGNFDVVLLDVNMPEVDGYQVCSKIKQSAKGMQIPVLFLSGKKSGNDIVKGYDSGAADYITKPFKVEELYSKVIYEIELYKKRLEIESSLQTTTTALLSVQNDNAKIYSICRFLQKTFSCKDINSLCENLFVVTRTFGTHATLLVHSDHHRFFISDNGINHEISNNVLEMMQNGDRIFRFGRDRAIFNWSTASLLVEKLQSDVDNLALLMDGFESGVKAIEGVDNFYRILDKYREQTHQMNVQVAQVFEDVVEQTHSKLASLGAISILTVAQEDELAAIADTHLEEVDNLFRASLGLDEELTRVVEQMRSGSSQEEEEVADNSGGIAFF